jgi:hypothetical protein
LALAIGPPPAAADPIITRPFDPAYDCVRGLDSIGSVVASGGDFNGDGIGDFAYAAPCSPTNKGNGAGRVWIRSGANGVRLRLIRGRQEKGYFGAALAFVGDLNNDGKDELAIGSPLADVPVAGTNPLQDAGQVRIITQKRRGPYLLLNGTYPKSELGGSVAAISDLDNNGKPDLLVGAPGEQLSAADTKKTGAVYVYSSTKGRLIHRIAGIKAGQRFGTTVQSVESSDEDELRDILITSEKNPVGGVINAGAIEVRSSASPETILMTLGGAKNDRLGASSAASSIRPNFIVGSPGWSAGSGLNRSGAVTLYSEPGAIHLTAAAPVPQLTAQFGTGVAVLGDVNNDTVPDFAASEPYRDVAADPLDGSISENVGRVTYLSGSDGSAILSVDGVKADARLGRSLAGGIDRNDDGITDIITGNPGDSPRGLRGAGSDHIYSGADGSRLQVFRGKRGLETRIFAVKRLGGTAGVRSFNIAGRKVGVNATVHDNAALAQAAMSIDVLDRTATPAVPAGVRVVVGTGSGAGSSHVAVLSATAKQNILSEFEAFPGEPVGANVAAGDLYTNDVDEIVVAEGSSETGDVRVRIFSQDPNNPFLTGWNFQHEFLAFSADDTIGLHSIDADGANVVVVGLRPTPGREIVAAPAAGQPIVRVFDQLGNPLLEWQAYDFSSGVDGLSIVAIDLDGNGNYEIATAPMTGPGLVRVFNNDGLPFSMPGSTDPVQFLALDEGDNSGLRLASADVDLDGRQEILVVSAEAGSNQINAYEADGSLVDGFNPINSMSAASDVDIAAIDRFLLR